MCCLADRNNEDTAIRVQIKEIVARLQDTAFAMHMPRKSPADGRFAQGVVKNVASNFFHSSFKRFSILSDKLHREVIASVMLLL
jgi:hypothetical protein